MALIAMIAHVALPTAERLDASPCRGRQVEKDAVPYTINTNKMVELASMSGNPMAQSCHWVAGSKIRLQGLG
jgi:hypothetical protein